MGELVPKERAAGSLPQKVRASVWALEVSLPKAPGGTAGTGHWQGQRHRPRIGCGPREASCFLF